MKARMLVTRRRLGGQWATLLVPLLVVFLSTSPRAYGGYIESDQTWSTATSAAWVVKDLSGAPFNVPPFVVVEVAVANKNQGTERSGGLRSVGSSLERRLTLHKSEGQGLDYVVMHVQTDINSQIESYAEDKTDVTYVLLGYWECGTYVEAFTSFTAGADASWQTHNLSTEGVSASEVAEIVMVNKAAAATRQTGVRTNGSGLSRLLNLHNAQGGGVDHSFMITITASAS